MLHWRVLCSYDWIFFQAAAAISNMCYTFAWSSEWYIQKNWKLPQMNGKCAMNECVKVYKVCYNYLYFRVLVLVLVHLYLFMYLQRVTILQMIFPFNYFLRGRASDVVSETDGWVIVVGRGPQWKEWVAGENMNTLLIKDTVRLDKTVTLCPAARPERLFVNIAFSFIHRRTKIGHMCLQSAHVGPACEASTNWVTSCWLDVHMSGEN